MSKGGANRQIAYLMPTPYEEAGIKARNALIKRGYHVLGGMIRPDVRVEDTDVIDEILEMATCDVVVTVAGCEADPTAVAVASTAGTMKKKFAHIEKIAPEARVKPMEEQS